MQQWLAKGLHQYNQPLATYNQDRFNTSKIEADQSDHAALGICHQFQSTELQDGLTNLSNRGMAIMTEGFNVTITKSQTEGGIHMLLKLGQIIIIMILLLLY